MFEREHGFLGNEQVILIYSATHAKIERKKKKVE
jgi:hypothetical protein